jgi:hypothetical protein
MCLDATGSFPWTQSDRQAAQATGIEFISVVEPRAQGQENQLTQKVQLFAPAIGHKLHKHGLRQPNAMSAARSLKIWETRMRMLGRLAIRLSGTLGLCHPQDDRRNRRGRPAG